MDSRTTFNAFVASEATGQVIESAIGDLGEVVVSTTADLDKAVKLAGVTGPSLVFLELPMESERLDRQLSLLRELLIHKPLLPIVAVAENDSKHLLLEAMRSGATDFLVSDVDRDEFRERVITLRQQAPRKLSANLNGSRSRITALIGGRPDENSALLASQLSLSIQESLPDGGRALLLDVGFPSNDAMTILGLSSEYSLVDGIRHVHSIDPLLIETAFPQHQQGLRALSVGEDSDDWSEVRADDVMLFIDALSHYFSHVVINLNGVSDLELIQAFSRRADHVLVYATQTITSFRANQQLLDEIRAREGMAAKLELVLDDYERDVLPTAQTLSDKLQVPLTATFQTDHKTRLEVINTGKPFESVDKRGGYAKALRRLVKRLMGTPPSPQGLKGFISQMLSRNK